MKTQLLLVTTVLSCQAFAGESVVRVFRTTITWPHQAVDANAEAQALKAISPNAEALRRNTEDAAKNRALSGSTISATGSLWFVTEGDRRAFLVPVPATVEGKAETMNVFEWLSGDGVLSLELGTGQQSPSAGLRFDPEMIEIGRLKPTEGSIVHHSGLLHALIRQAPMDLPRIQIDGNKATWLAPDGSPSFTETFSSEGDKFTYRSVRADGSLAATGETTGKPGTPGFRAEGKSFDRSGNLARTYTIEFDRVETLPNGLASLVPAGLDIHDYRHDATMPPAKYVWDGSIPPLSAVSAPWQSNDRFKALLPVGFGALLLIAATASRVRHRKS